MSNDLRAFLNQPFASRLYEIIYFRPYPHDDIPFYRFTRSNFFSFGKVNCAYAHPAVVWAAEIVIGPITASPAQRRATAPFRTCEQIYACLDQDGIVGHAIMLRQA